MIIFGQINLLCFVVALFFPKEGQVNALSLLKDGRIKPCCLKSTTSSNDYNLQLPTPVLITRRSFGYFMGSSATVSFGLFPSKEAKAEAPADGTKKLSFETLESGVRVADILVGARNNDDAIVKPTSKVNVHIIGRLLGKQGWIFEDSKAAGEDPFRLDLGTGTVVPGLEQGLLGMRLGGRRRIVVPSAVGYTSRQLEPIPRDFGNRQQLYTTVMNNVRIERERQALGADLAGVVVFDVQLMRFRN